MSKSNPRIGVACVMQETNTFSPALSTVANFDAQGILEGEELLTLAGTNTEPAGAVSRLRERNVDAVPVFRAWAMSAGPITAEALDQLLERFRACLTNAGPLDGLVLALHGAFVGASVDCADLAVIDAARSVLGELPIGVSLDLHANVTSELVSSASFVTGYHTYPHVDMAATGARAADLLVALIRGDQQPVTFLAKRPFLIPAEAQGDDGPFGGLRAMADAATSGAVLDITLFPVQPWLDVPELGYGVTVTTDGDAELAADTSEAMAEAAWRMRKKFKVELLQPSAAIAEARISSERPMLMTESADSPSAGAAADSPAMIRALLEHASDLRSYVTLVDVAAVDSCFQAGIGTRLRLRMGSSIDSRFHEPVDVEATVAVLGDKPYRLTGPVFNGMEYTMGRHARLDHDRLSILVTELPACTFDPEPFRHVGLEPRDADIVVIRSAHMYRAGWAGMFARSIVLDLPGASTPKLSSLNMLRAPRPLFPLDEI